MNISPLSAHSDLAASQPVPGPLTRTDERSRLHEVIDALLDLEEPQISAMS